VALTLGLGFRAPREARFRIVLQLAVSLRLCMPVSAQIEFIHTTAYHKSTEARGAMAWLGFVSGVPKVRTTSTNWEKGLDHRRGEASY
jgi:hypothetical protein